MVEADSKNVFQIYLTDDDSVPVPTPLLECVKKVHDLRGEHSHFLVRGEQLRAIISENFGAEVVGAYDKLVPYAYRADLGRYCLLYLYGGWYFDMTCRPQMEIPLLDGLDFFLFKDAPVSGRNTWGVQNSVFHAKKGQEFLLRSIEQVVRHCREEFYGTDSLYVTGPGLLGRNVSLHAQMEKGGVGSYLPLTPMHYQKNFAFVLPRGHILAWGKETAGTPDGTGLGALGTVGGNSYGLLWTAREVYRKTADKS